MSVSSHILSELIAYGGQSFRIRSQGQPERSEIRTTLELGESVLLSKSAPYNPMLEADAISRALELENRTVRQRLLAGHLDSWLGRTVPSQSALPAAITVSATEEAPKRSGAQSPAQAVTRKTRPGRWAVKVGRVEAPFESQGGKTAVRAPAAPAEVKDDGWTTTPPPATRPASRPPTTSARPPASPPAPPLKPKSAPPAPVKRAERDIATRAEIAPESVRTIGPYRLIERLERDCYVAVAGSTTGERIVRFRLHPKAAARLSDEARALLRVENAGIVPVIEVGQNEEDLFLASSWVDGRTAHALLARCSEIGKPLPVDITAWIVREMARALEALHAGSRTHGAIDAHHVIIGHGGDVRVLGLGDALGQGGGVAAPDDTAALGELLLTLLGRGEVLGTEKMHAVRAPFVSPALLQVATRARGDSAVRDPLRSAQSVYAALGNYLSHDAPRTDGTRLARLMAELFPTGAAEDTRRREEWLAKVRTLAPATKLAASKPPKTETVVLPPEKPRDLELAPGTVVDGRYCLQRLCGRGGMGWVYEAEHQGIGKRVAIKILHPIYSRAPDVAERFRREARAASKIGHPHIIDVLDFGTTDDGCLYIAMEYLDGRDLGTLLEEVGCLPLDRAVRISEQICLALEAAHAVGIVHRDLKPENIFLLERPDVPDFIKVLDFGIAKHLEDPTQEKLTRPNIALGTPEYMAPEQVAGKTDPRSDIYSVGAMLYEMLVGTPPFEGEHYLEIFRRKAVEDPAAPSAARHDVTAELDQIVLRALARQPQDRPQSMAEMAAELSKLLS